MDFIDNTTNSTHSFSPYLTSSTTVIPGFPLYEITHPEIVHPTYTRVYSCAHCRSEWEEDIFHAGTCGNCGSPEKKLTEIKKEGE